MNKVKDVDMRGQLEDTGQTSKRRKSARKSSASADQGLLDNLLTAETICAKFGISTATVYRLIEEGLPTYKLRGSRRFPEKKVVAWLAQRRTA